MVAPCADAAAAARLANHCGCKRTFGLPGSEASSGRDWQKEYEGDGSLLSSNPELTRGSVRGLREEEHPAIGARIIKRGKEVGRRRCRRGKSGKRRCKGRMKMPAVSSTGAPLVDPVGMTNWGGGDVMFNPMNVYIYWVGNFTETQKAVTRTFVRSLNPSSDPAVTSEWLDRSACFGGRPLSN
jgi:hypothetical protein